METNTTQRVERRKYSDAERANALAVVASCGGSSEKAASVLGISARTLRGWVSGEDDEDRPDVLELRKQAKEDLASRFEKLAEVALGIAEAKIGQLDAKAAAIVGAIAVDKSLLLRGSPTAITESRSSSDQADRVRRLQELFGARAGNRYEGLPPTAVQDS